MSVSLNSYWNYTSNDNCTSVNGPVGKWVLVREEAQIVTAPFYEFGVLRTVPLKLLYSKSHSDYLSVATAEAEALAYQAGYALRGTIGHIWPIAPRHYTRALKQYWHPVRQDYFLTGTAVGELSAIDAGYEFVRIEGYSGAEPDFSGDFLGDGDVRNHIPWRSDLQQFESARFGMNLQFIYWGMLLHGDNLYDRTTVAHLHSVGANESRDCISFTEEAIDQTKIEFVLRLNPSVTWWKEIALYDRTQGVIQSVSVEGTAQARLSFDVKDVVGRLLIFSKAKRGGAHVRQYGLLDLSAKRGKRIIFTWLKDNEPSDRTSLAWQFFSSERLNQGDLIRLHYGPGDPDFLKLKLTATRKAAWWKQVRLIHPDRSLGEFIETSGSQHESAILQIPKTQLPGARLLLSKAMALGVHTALYEIGDLAAMKGNFVELEWVRDDIPDPSASIILVARMGYRIYPTWGILNFAITHCDGDIITPTVEDLGPGREQDVEIVVRTGGTVSWWKGLNLYNVLDVVVATTGVEGLNQQSSPIQGRYADLWWANLVFVKSKAFGIREEKYEHQLSPLNLRRLQAAPGKRLVFTWSADNLPQPESCT